MHFPMIEKSGTGIGKSDTSIEKSGTGIARGRWPFLSMLVGALFAVQGMAAEPQVLLTADNSQLFVSVHAEEGILVGHAAGLNEAGYYRLALYAAVGAAGSSAILQPLVAGSGSGSSKEVAGSGSGSSTEVAGSGSGSSTEVAGSGSGSSTEVAGSGSGSAGEGCLSGVHLLVAGSGSGSAGEASGCGIQPWGFAELVVDADGIHIIVNRFASSGAVEYLLAYLPAASSLRTGEESPRGYVLKP